MASQQPDEDMLIDVDRLVSAYLRRAPGSVGPRAGGVFRHLGSPWTLPGRDLGLLGGSLAFGGEESAGASFLRHDGSASSTDKDGLIMCLLAAEMTARGGKDSGELYAELTGRYGAPVYRRVDTPATPEQKRALGALAPDDVRATELAGEPIAQVLTTAPSRAGKLLDRVLVRNES
jgi:phosphoglucomutase